MSTHMQVTVVLPGWLGAEDRAKLLGFAASLDGGSMKALAFAGQASATAIAAHVAQQLASESGAQCVLAPAGTEGEAIASLIASQANGTSLGRCIALSLEGSAVKARRAVYGGRAEIEMRSQARVTCATLRPEQDAQGNAGVPITEVALDEPAPTAVEPVAAQTSVPRVEGAKLVVSGGRGMAGPEGFELLARVANALGAGLAGSLPAVDAGWVPVAHQVGQSGKFVTPKVYFAVGISGTPQHLAGIAGGTRVVALNNDPEAAIFKRADIGVEADWRELLPLLALQLESRRG
jgi:electron transfer flavoprotein alpha subunit